MAAAGLPWKEIIKTASLAAGWARELWQAEAAKSREVVDPGADAKSQLLALSRRLEELQGTNAEQAKLMKLLAEEMQAIARRATIAYRVGIGGIVLAAASLLPWLLR